MFDTDNDYMQIGGLIPMENGWYYDTVTDKKIRFDEDGNAVDESGLQMITKSEEEECSDYYLDTFSD